MRRNRHAGENLKIYYAIIALLVVAIAISVLHRSGEQGSISTRELPKAYCKTLYLNEPYCVVTDNERENGDHYVIFTRNPDLYINEINSSVEPEDIITAIFSKEDYKYYIDGDEVFDTNMAVTLLIIPRFENGEHISYADAKYIIGDDYKSAEREYLQKGHFIGETMTGFDSEEDMMNYIKSHGFVKK